MVTVRFYQELNGFLAPGLRGRPIDVDRQPRTVRELIQDLGVPHTQVDLVLVNGVSVSFDDRLRDGDFVSVYPVFETLDVSSVTRVRPVALREPRFLLDVHLGALARLLRMLGFDAAWERDAADAELAGRAAASARTLLTRDRELLKRTAVTHGYWLRSTEPREQAVDVLRRFDLVEASRPFSRCLRCNVLLEPLDAPPATVPPPVRAGTRRFVRCPGCGRAYWQGSHWLGMRRTAEELLAAARTSRDLERRQ